MTVHLVLGTKKSIGRIVALAIVLPLIARLYAQNPVVDSLRAQVAISKEHGNASDTSLARTMVQLTNKLLAAGEYDSVLQRSKGTLELLERLKKAGADTFALRQSAVIHRILGRRAFYVSDYPGSVRELQQALVINESLGDTQQMGATLNLLTYTYRELRDTAAALEQNRRAISLLRSIEPSRELAMGLMNLGGTFSYIGETDSAAHYLYQALDQYRSLGPKSQIAAAHLNLSELYNGTGQYDSSIHHFLQAEPYASALGLGAMIRYHGIHARVLLLQGRPKDALEQIRMAEEMAQDGPTDLAILKELQGLAFAGLGNMDDALTALRQSREAIEKDLGLDKVREVTELRMTHEQRIAAALAEAQLEKHKQEKRSVTVGAVLLAIIAILLFRSYLLSKRNARSLQTKNDQLLAAQNELVRSEKEREAAQVRTRIARDIHDEIGGELTRIRLLGNEVRHLMQVDKEAASETIERMARSAQEATGALRDIVWATDPGRDTVQGLIDHLPDMLHRQVEGSGIRIDMKLHHDGPDQNVDPAWKSQILRIVKEAVNNAVKYSEARSINLTFRSGPQDYELIVQDDGVGFDPEVRKDGNGLRNMRARTAAINGQFQIRSSAGSGCTITVSGPIPTDRSAVQEPAQRA